MKEDFYDRVAKKFGGYGYSSEPVHKNEYPSGNPEKIFKQKLLGLSSKNKMALDIGCADGKFTLSVAPYFKKVYGIDTSKRNLAIAKSHNQDKKSKNVEYSYQDANRTSFNDSSFGLAFCRRGPSYYEEYHRILKSGGHYIEIGIGEMDAQELKKMFGRGQDYGKWDSSKLDKNLEKLQSLGFAIVFAKDFHNFEYYQSYEDLDLFLQGVPIFEDFDSKKDKILLRKYTKEFSSDQGIQLSRHRLVMVARKSGK